MASFNKVLLMGNLTRKPELRYTPSGMAVCEFTIAVNRRFTQGGETKEDTCFVDITVWDRQADNCNKYLDKGSSVFIEGRLQLDRWVDKTDQKQRSRLRVVAENVQFVGARREGGDYGDGGGAQILVLGLQGHGQAGAALGDVVGQGGGQQGQVAGDAEQVGPAGGGQGGGTTVTTADELFSALSAGVGEITLEAGTYDFTSVSATGLSEDGVYTVSGDLSLTADGDVFVIGAFKFGAGAGDVILDGITFSGNNQAIGNFLEDVEGETAVQSVIVRNCEISGYGKSIIYVSKDGSSISSIEFTGNHIHDMGTGQGSFDIRKGSVGSLTVQSNTINNGSRDMFRADADVTGMSSMVIANNTFANITGGNSNGFARVRAVVAGGITISNNLFLNMMSSNYPFVHSNTTSENTVNLSNNFFYNFHEEWFSDMDEATATANGGAVLTASPVADIEGGDFTLTNAVLMAKKAGDPRWNPQADMPSSSSIEVNSIDELVNAIASGATDFTLNAGTYDFRTPGASGVSGFSEDGVLTASSDLSLRGNGDVIVIGGIKLGAGLSSLYLYGIHFDGASQAVGNFIEDVDGATASTAISVRNCEISGYAKSIIYVSKETSSVGDVEFAGNLIHDMGTGQGSFDIRKGAAVSLTVMNNTIYNGSRDIFRIDADVAGVSGVSISNNTFYNITGGNSNGFARIRAAVSGGITISNNIFVDMLSSNYPFVHSNTSSENIVNISNNFFYNFHEEWFSDMDEATAIANGGAVLTASPLADPANGDFTVTDATVKAAGAGDGRWL